MKYQLFLSDFDGTLVRADGGISEENKRAIARYRAAGGTFVVVTGRMLSSILPRLGELGLKEGLVVAYQGATIADIATGKLLKNECFSPSGALAAVRALEAEDHHIHVYTPEGLFANRRDEMLAVYEHICGVRGEVVEGGLSNWLQERQPSVIKVLAMLEPERKGALKARLEREMGREYFVTCSADWLVEIMPAGQSKAAAVEFLSRYYHVPKERIAAIGDQLNDLPMLQEAAGKFTVANGQEELKQIARVMPSNEENGVAAALEIAMGEL